MTTRHSVAATFLALLLSFAGPRGVAQHAAAGQGVPVSMIVSIEPKHGDDVLHDYARRHDGLPETLIASPSQIGFLQKETTRGLALAMEMVMPQEVHEPLPGLLLMPTSSNVEDTVRSKRLAFAEER